MAAQAEADAKEAAAKETNTPTQSTPTQSGEFNDTDSDGVRAADVKPADGFGTFLYRAIIFGTIAILLLLFEFRYEQPLRHVNEAMMLNNRNDPENAFAHLSDDERNEQAAELGQAIIDAWKPMDDPQNPGMRTIGNRAQAKMTKAKIAEISALAPTSPEIIKEINELIDIYNVQTRRHSVASPTVITLVVVFLMGFGFIGYCIGKHWFFLGYGFDLIAYLVAARAPLYLIQNGWGIAPSVFSEAGAAITGAAIGGLGSYEETRYIDRSTGSTVHTETDHTEGIISLIFLAMLAGITIAVLPLLVLLNVVRNHVIYA
jgi:hypothetical protein